MRRNAADDDQAERILANRFYRNISGALSGTQEYMAAETLHQLHGDERFDLVVVDTPPSRNALDFLEAPGVLARFLDHRLFRLLMLPARRGMRVVNAATQPLLRAIGRVVGSDVLADAVAFFQAFAGMEAGFRQRAEDVIAPAALGRHPLRHRRLAAPRHGDRGGVVRRAARRAGHRRGSPASPTGSTRRSGRAPRPRPRRSGRRGRAADVAALWRNVAELRALAEAARDELAPFAALLGDAPAGRGAAAVRRRPRPRRARRDPPPPVRRAVTATGTFRGVKVLLATDADWLVEDVVAALGGPDTSFTVCSEGREVAGVVEAARRPPASRSTSAIFDLQIGSMGGMAVTMSLRLDASSGRLPARPGADAARPGRRRPPGPPQRRRGLARQAARPAAPAPGRARRRRRR